MNWTHGINFAASWLRRPLGRKARVIGLSLGLVVFIAAVSCAPAVGKKDLLAFVQVGQTTREDVYLHLADPNAKYEQFRILTYKIGEDEAGLFLVSASGWTDTRYSLVFAFDEKGVLRRYSLVPVDR
jgi:hypothetical protein